MAQLLKNDTIDNIKAKKCIYSNLHENIVILLMLWLNLF